jgi:hypothetical protein
MLDISSRFRVNSYIKTVLSKTWKNSRLKTKYLKEIMVEQLFIISNVKFYYSSFYLTPNKLDRIITNFYLVFHDHTLI